MNAIEAHLAALRDAVEANYRRKVAPAEAERETQLAAIDALGQKLLGSVLPDHREHNGDGGGGGLVSKVEILLKALSPQFKSVAELAIASGLSRDEVSAALSRPRVRAVLKRRGKAGSLKYGRLRPAGNAKSPNGNVAKAIRVIVAKHPDGISRTELVDAVEKLSVSQAKAPRVAISSTVTWMVSSGQIRSDAEHDRLFTP